MPFAIAAGVAAGSAIAAGAAVTAVGVATIVAGAAVAASLAMVVVGLATGDKGLVKIGGYVGLAGGIIGGAASLAGGAAAAGAEGAGAAAASAAEPAAIGAAGGLSESAISSAITPTLSSSVAPAVGETAALSGATTIGGEVASNVGSAAITPALETATSTGTQIAGNAIQETPSLVSSAAGAVKEAAPANNASWLEGITGWASKPVSNGSSLVGTVAQLGSGAIQGMNSSANQTAQNGLIAQNQNYNQYLAQNSLFNSNSPGRLNVNTASVTPDQANAYKLSQAELAKQKAGILSKSGA